MPRASPTTAGSMAELRSLEGSCLRGSSVGHVGTGVAPAFNYKQVVAQLQIGVMLGRESYAGKPVQPP